MALLSQGASSHHQLAWRIGYAGKGHLGLDACLQQPLQVPLEERSVPVITFAEDACLGSANIVLTSGVKTYAST